MSRSYVIEPAEKTLVLERRPFAIWYDKTSTKSKAGSNDHAAVAASASKNTDMHYRLADNTQIILRFEAGEVPSNAIGFD